VASPASCTRPPIRLEIPTAQRHVIRSAIIAMRERFKHLGLLEAVRRSPCLAGCSARSPAVGPGSVRQRVLSNLRWPFVVPAHLYVFPLAVRDHPHLGKSPFGVFFIHRVSLPAPLCAQSPSPVPFPSSPSDALSFRSFLNSSKCSLSSGFSEFRRFAGRLQQGWAHCRLGRRARTHSRYHPCSSKESKIGGRLFPATLPEYFPRLFGQLAGAAISSRLLIGRETYPHRAPSVFFEPHKASTSADLSSRPPIFQASRVLSGS